MACSHYQAGHFLYVKQEQGKSPAVYFCHCHKSRQKV